MSASTRHAWILGLTMVGLPGCRLELLVGVVEAGSGEDSEAEGSTTILAEESTSGDDDDSSTDGGSTDDTDTGTTTFLDTTGPLPECEAPKGHSTCDADGDVMHTIGLGCPSGPFDSTAVENVDLQAPDLASFQTVREYGNASFTATEGSKLLVVSTGTLPMPDGSDRIELPLGQTYAADGGNDNPDGQALPDPIVTASGSDGTPFSGCDGTGDCSDSLADPWAAGGPANDLWSVSWDVEVPPGTFGYDVDLAWFSTDFPRQVGEVGDLVVWWQSSEAFTGNVATIDGAALSATGAADLVVEGGFVGNATELDGTGYEGTEASSCSFPGGNYAQCPRGGSTGWLVLRGRTHPGEVMRTTVAVFDLGDDDMDTAVLLDNWRWNCSGCTPGSTCGLQAP